MHHKKWNAVNALPDRSVCLSLFVSVCLSPRLSVCRSICTDERVCLSVYQPACTFSLLPVCQSISMSIWLYVCLSEHLLSGYLAIFYLPVFIYITNNLSVHKNVCPSVLLSVQLSAYFTGWVLSLTLVTFFFETSKPQANIYYALVGLECQA